MEFSLVKVNNTDIAFLLALRINTMSEHFENANLTLSSADHLERVKDKLEQAFFIYFNGERVGMLKYEESDSVCKIYQLQILPEHQSRGFGKTILKWIIASTSSETLKLRVLKGNRALSLYTKLGFIKVDEDKYEYYLQCKLERSS